MEITICHLYLLYIETPGYIKNFYIDGFVRILPNNPLSFPIIIEGGVLSDPRILNPVSKLDGNILTLHGKEYDVDSRSNLKFKLRLSLYKWLGRQKDFDFNNNYISSIIKHSNFSPQVYVGWNDLWSSEHERNVNNSLNLGGYIVVVIM